MEDNNQTINSQYDEFKRILDDAARIKTDINSTQKEAMKTYKREFSEFMLDNVDPDFRVICERLGLFNGFAEIEDKKKREKKEQSAMRSFFGKMFKIGSDFEYTKKGGRPKDTTPPKSHSYAMGIIASLYASRVLPEVKQALDYAGIEVRFTKPITKLDLVNNEDDKNSIIHYLTAAANTQNEIFEKNAEIEDVIYENIPEEMKNSEVNPKGIKKSQFSALAELQSKTDELSMNGDADKASDIVEKQSDKHMENSKNQEMLAIMTELILTKSNEPEKPENYDVEGEEPEVVENDRED